MARRPRPALLIAALLAPAPAAALTCLEVSAFEAFDRAQDAPEPHAVLLGRLRFDPASLQGVPTGRLLDGDLVPEIGPPPPFVASFEGQALTRRGFAPSAVAAVTVVPTCGSLEAPCPSVTPGEPVLLFVREDAGGWALDLAPCAATVLPAPPPDVRRGLARCLRDGRCDP